MKTVNRLNKDKKAFLSKVEKLWPVAKGSLSEVRKPCIRANCSACAEGKKHKAFIFSYNEKGRRKCLYVPRHLAPVLRRAIRNGRKLEEYISGAGAELILQNRSER